MPTITSKLMQAAAASRGHFNASERRRVARFIRAQWNADGGVRGREGEHSDLYYTVFALVTMRALGLRPPYLKTWKYIRAFGDGGDLDLLQLFCLTRLRSFFPMSGVTRANLTHAADRIEPESAYDMFFKVITSEYLGGEHLPDAGLKINELDPTTHIAAAAVVNMVPDPMARDALLRRAHPTGGFIPEEGGETPDLISTVTALFALRIMGYSLSESRKASIPFVESLQREGGGFAARVDDPVADSENTYYALLAVGCLMD